MRDVAASLFALEQRKDALSIDESDCAEICAGSKKLGNRQVKVAS
jgi:hypothetical protein